VNLLLRAIQKILHVRVSGQSWPVRTDASRVNQVFLPTADDKRAGAFEEPTTFQNSVPPKPNMF
jgi:hypothetical protein